MAPTLTSSLIVRLIDQVTSPARKVGSALMGLNKTANGISGTFGARLGSAIQKNNAALDNTRGRMVDAVAGFYALKEAIGAPIMSATKFETKMLDIAQKADLSDAAIAQLRSRILGMSKDLGTSSSAMANAVDDLLGKGMSPDDAMAIIGPITKTAAAYRAASEEVASASFSVMDNLKLPADQVAKALDIMAQAGKDGAFELKDMATEFPALTARAQALGMRGVDAVSRLSAALQIARKGAGTSAEAANNVANLMQKVISPETTKKFKSFGIDIRSELKKTQAAGGDVFELIANETLKATKGDLSKIGDIFQDSQVQGALLPLIQNLKEYQKIRDDAGKAKGVVDDDFDRRIKTAQGTIDRLSGSMEWLSISVGNALLPLVQLGDKLTALTNRLVSFSDRNPELTRNVIAAAGALVAFKIATTALTFAGLIGRGGALSMLSFGFNTVGRAAIGASRAVKEAVGLQTALGAMSGMKLTGLQTLGISLRAMVLAVPGVSAISGALAAIGGALAAISAPAWGLIAIGVAAVAAAGALLWHYWDRVSSVVSGFASRLGQELAPAIKLIQPALDLLAPVIRSIGEAFDWAKQKLSDFADWLGSFFQREVLTDDQKAGFAKAGSDVADSMINSIKSAFRDLLAWFTGLPGMIRDAIGNIDVSSLIDVSGIKSRIVSALGFGSAAPAADTSNAPAPAPTGHRARGGRVWPGGSFEVGEKGAERFTPTTAGTITPAGAAGARSVGNVTINITTIGNAKETAREIERVLADDLGVAIRGAHTDGSMW